MKLGDITPRLRMFDEHKTREFYVDFLGFTIEWEHRYGDDFPLFMEVSRDDVTIHLSEHHGDACPGSTIQIEVDDVESYQAELLAKKYKYARPDIAEQEWGSLDMVIADPAGNRLIFSQSPDEDSDTE